MAKSRLEEQYKTFRPELQKELGLKNIMEVPRLSKIVLNVGIKGGDNKQLQLAEKILTAISGQRPVRTKARKSIAGFKLREGMPIGVKVTLRSAQMYEFLDRLINFVLPGVRDFQGVGSRFDRRGGYNLGIKDCSVFQESGDVLREKNVGMNVTIHTTAPVAEQGRALLEKLGMPFRKA